MPMLSEDELERFRTKFCTLTRTSGCEFGPERCNYSHNDYWPRRCPFYLKDRSALRYVPVCCPEVKLGSGDTVMESKCPRGGHCPFAHSAEEIWYHPLIYKVQVCEEYRRGECDRYYCPKVHGLAEQRCPKCYNLPYCRGVNIPHFPGVTIVDKLKSPSVRRGTSRAAAHSGYSNFPGGTSSGCHYNNEGNYGCSRSNSALKGHKAAETKGSTFRPFEGVHSVIETSRPSCNVLECNDSSDCEELDKIGMVTKDWFAAYGCSEDEDARSMDVSQGDFVRVWVRNKNGWLYCQCIQGSNATAEGWLPAFIVHELPQDYAGDTQNKKWQSSSELEDPSLQRQPVTNARGVKADSSKTENRQSTISSSGSSPDVAAMFSLLTTNDSLFQMSDYPLSLPPLPPTIEKDESLHDAEGVTVPRRAETYDNPSSLARQDSMDACGASGGNRTSADVLTKCVPSATSDSNIEEHEGKAIMEQESKIPEVIQIEKVTLQLEVLSKSRKASLEHWNKIVSSAFDLLGAALVGQRSGMTSNSTEVNSQKRLSTFLEPTIEAKEPSEDAPLFQPVAADETKLPEGETISTDPSIASDKIGGESPSKCGAICNSMCSDISDQKKRFDGNLSSAAIGNSTEAWMDWKIVCPDLLSSLDGANTEDVLSQIETTNQQKFCDFPEQYSCHDLFSTLFSPNGSAYQVAGKSNVEPMGSCSSDANVGRNPTS